MCGEAQFQQSIYCNLDISLGMLLEDPGNSIVVQMTYNLDTPRQLEMRTLHVNPCVTFQSYLINAEEAKNFQLP